MAVHHLHRRTLAPGGLPNTKTFSHTFLKYQFWSIAPTPIHSPTHLNYDCKRTQLFFFYNFVLSLPICSHIKINPKPVSILCFSFLPHQVFLSVDEAMASLSFAKLNASSSQWIAHQSFSQKRGSSSGRRLSVSIRAGAYSDELVQTAVSFLFVCGDLIWKGMWGCCRDLDLMFDLHLLEF